MPLPNAPVLTVGSGGFSYSLKGQPNTGNVVPGDAITYSIRVRNLGSAPAHAVVVRASFDSNLARFVSASTSFSSVSGNVVTWTFPDSQPIAEGGEVTLTYKVRVKAGVDTRSGFTLGSVVQSATALSPSVNLPASDLPSITLHVVPPFNLSTADDGVSARGGGPLTFTFTVTNRGTETVSDITADVGLPDGYVPANFNSAMLIDDNGNPVGAPYKLGAQLDNGQIDPSAVRFYIDSLPAGANQRFLVTVNLRPDTAPNSVVNLSSVQLNGHVSPNGDLVTYSQYNYGAKISNLPPLAPPSVGIIKLVPTAAYLQTLLTAAGDPASFLHKPAMQFFLALSLYKGQSPADLQAMSADQLERLLNPYVTLDTDPATGGSLYDVPSPNGKQPDPYVTYFLLFFNAGGGDAAGISISDTVASGLTLDRGSVTFKGQADFKGSAVADDGRSLTFTFGKVKKGTGGLIVYQAHVPAPASGGPALGAVIDPTTTALITASLSGQNFYTPAESLLITGKENAIVSSSESDPGDGTAVYTIYYKNTGGKKFKDLIVTSQVPTGGIFQSAQFLDIGQSHREPDQPKGETIHPPASATSGNVVFELGRVKPREQGFVQVTYKLGDAALANKPPGLVHHYGIDQTSLTAAVNRAPAGRPAARGASRGSPQGFNLGDVGNFFKQGFDNVLHAIGRDYAKPGTPQPAAVAPTIFVQQVAPLAVQEDTDFTYFITVGNNGKTGATVVDCIVRVPTGATFVSTTRQDRYFVDGDTFSAGLSDLPPGETTTFTVTFHATAPAGSSVVSADTLANAFSSAGIAGYNSGQIHIGGTSSLVYSAQQANNFPALQTQIATNAAQAGGIDPAALSSSALFAQHAAQITPNSTQTAVAHADYLTTKEGATIVASGGGNIVASGGGNIVAAGGGNIVASGGGNIVASGGGNIVASGGGNITFNNVTGLGTVNASQLLSADGVAKIVAAGGGNIVAAGGGNLISNDGGSILNYQNGNALISTSALQFSLVAAAGIGNAQSLGLLSNDGGGIIADHGDGLIGNDGGSLISNDGGGFKAVGGGSALIGNDGGGFITRSAKGSTVRRSGNVKAGTVLGSPANSISFDFNNAGGMVFGKGGSKAGGQ